MVILNTMIYLSPNTWFWSLIWFQNIRAWIEKKKKQVQYQWSWQTGAVSIRNTKHMLAMGNRRAQILFQQFIILTNRCSINDLEFKKKKKFFNTKLQRSLYNSLTKQRERERESDLPSNSCTHRTFFQDSVQSMRLPSPIFPYNGRAVSSN